MQSVNIYVRFCVDTEERASLRGLLNQYEPRLRRVCHINIMLCFKSFSQMLCHRNIKVTTTQITLRLLHNDLSMTRMQNGQCTRSVRMADVDKDDF